MKTILLISLLSVVISGCTVNLARQPLATNVALIPDDCANLPAIEQWLEYQLAQDKSVFETQNEYRSAVQNIKTRLWGMRATCNGMRNSGAWGPSSS